MLFFDSKFYCSSAMAKAVSKEMRLVTVAVSSGDIMSAAANETELSFSTSNWNSAQTVTVIGVDDEIDNTLDRNLNVTHAASGGDYASVSKNLAVTVTDDEGTSSLSVDDARADEGDTDTASLQFTVNLSPAADHQVREDWATSKETADTSKTVTVTSDQVDERHETLTLSNASGAALGDTIATGTITDDDTSGIVLTPDTVTVTEASGGRTADYKVKLATQPTAAVTVNKTSRSFSMSNWNTEQTGNGADDAIDNTPDRSLNVAHAPAMAFTGR